MPAPKDGPSAALDTKSGPEKNRDTELQSHVGYFDPDGDGIIWPSDTYVGFRDLGFGLLLSLLSMFVIHGGFSWITFGTFLPDPFFRLKTKHMHRGKHGSDSEAYTSIGVFDEDRFNYVFNMYSSEPHTHLTFSEAARMLYGNRNPFDPFGWFAATFEWLATYILLWPADGRMKKEDIRAVYDGSIFYKISKRKIR